MRKALIAPFLALALIGGTAACEREALPPCTEYQDEVLDADDNGECEEQEEQEEVEEDSDKKKKKSRKAKRR